MGEFYEMFYEDAEVGSRALGLTLTSRNNGGAAEVPLAGVPVKAAGEYLRRLVQQGFRVSICEQTEDPRQAKGIVRRGDSVGRELGRYYLAEILTYFPYWTTLYSILDVQLIHN